MARVSGHFALLPEEGDPPEDPRVEERQGKPVIWTKTSNSHKTKRRWQRWPANPCTILARRLLETVGNMLEKLSRTHMYNDV